MWNQGAHLVRKGFIRRNLVKLMADLSLTEGAPKERMESQLAFEIISSQAETCCDQEKAGV